MKNLKCPFGNGTRDLPACGAAPQPSVAVQIITLNSKNLSKLIFNKISSLKTPKSAAS
jgi:hypothetical protein